MINAPVSSQPGISKWGSLALVTYLPEPLGSYLTGLRQFLAEDHNPEAHITFLPPRPLSVSIDEAAEQVEEKLRSVAPFEVELGALRVFYETNMLYLDLTIGRNFLLNLHASLNSGTLLASESFEFIPHLTVSNPLPPAEIETSLRRAQAAWNDSDLPRRFMVSDVVLLWQPGDSWGKNWIRRSTFKLASAR